MTTSAIDRLWPHLLKVASGSEQVASVGLGGLSRDDLVLARSYLGFLTPGAGGMRVVAHLGQSLDGRIATASGHSNFVTGEEDFRHMHRLRALADAVIVGAGTVAHDDPQLTVRLVEGPNPVRVILDPAGRLTGERRIFHDDASPVLVLTGAGRSATIGNAEVIHFDRDDGVLEIADVLSVLRGRGLRRLFVEGGGVTVSRFLTAECLDELQLCIAPVIIGSGRPALTLPPIATMQEARRVEVVTVPLGKDVLVLCPLERSVGQPEQVKMANGGGGFA